MVEAVTEEPDTEEVATDEPEAEASVTEEKTEAEDNLEELPDLPEQEEVESLDSVALVVMTKAEIVERLKLVIAEPDRYARNEADTLKNAFYKIVHTETDTAKEAFLEGGGIESDFVMPDDELESQLKSLMSEYRVQRTAATAEEDRQKEANYLLKQQLIDRLKELTESQDDFNKRYNEFRDIQRKWKEIRSVPQDKIKELWHSYQLYNERFYDLVKINNQFRDYDFKKNLELKTALCETIERIEKEDDPISAFHQLQKLHQQWREIGPVAKIHRDAIWERFKAASTIVNKKYQDHFDELKKLEESNLKEKIALCEAVESIDYESLARLRDWDKKTKEVIDCQAKWKTIGFTTKKQNSKIFDRFRKACDLYFDKKAAFFKTVKKEMDDNVGIKKALIEKAEALKDSTDWKETTKIFVDLQNEWKKTGPVGHRYSEILWKQFSSAADHFFEQKNATNSSSKTNEQENLAAKKALLQKIKNPDESLKDEEAISILRDYISEWNEIGFVPFKEKDKLNAEYREAVNKQFDRLKVNDRDRDRRVQHRSNVNEIAGSGKSNKLFNERDRLLRSYDKLKSEVQTYENNIGFFNFTSKGGNGLLKEMDRKVTNLKEEMEVIVKKIEAIDENLE
ncbi:MAG: DUF349 domain-containing protein [Tannerella sp.]|nr:DUF349 domain-containing protein [Tannerella sp.]